MEDIARNGLNMPRFEARAAEDGSQRGTKTVAVVGKQKTAFDKNCVMQMDVMVLICVIICGKKESVLDETFVNIGVEGDRVQNNVVMTETWCNLNYSRARV